MHGRNETRRSCSANPSIIDFQRDFAYSFFEQPSINQQRGLDLPNKSVPRVCAGRAQFRRTGGHRVVVVVVD